MRILKLNFDAHPQAALSDPVSRKPVEIVGNVDTPPKTTSSKSSSRKGSGATTSRHTTSAKQPPAPSTVSSTVDSTSNDSSTQLENGAATTKDQENHDNTTNDGTHADDNSNGHEHDGADLTTARCKACHPLARDENLACLYHYPVTPPTSHRCLSRPRHFLSTVLPPSHTPLPTVPPALSCTARIPNPQCA